MTIISRNAVLSIDPTGEINANSPLIAYHNLVTISSVTSDTADASYPITNVANPLTFLEWRAANNTTQYVSVALGGFPGPVDYVAIAKHNLSSAGITVSVEGSNDGGATWPLTLVSSTVLSDDDPTILRFTAQVLTNVRLKFVGGTSPARIAVLYAGKLLVLQRRIYVGHSPMKYNRVVRSITGMSESGNFLGRVVLDEKRVSEVSLENLPPAWYRSYLDPFFVDAQQRPFFFAWRPEKYPSEVGFCWMTGNPSVTNSRNNGWMSASFSMEGIA
jgi:hypothetical protein